jgi:hypothetical protein
MSTLWILLIIGIVILFLVLGIVIFLIIRNRRPTVERSVPVLPVNVYPPNNIQRDYRPFRVVGSSDGSWFQVLDRQGNIVASFSNPVGNPTFEAECIDGQVETIGIRSTSNGNRIGPIGCTTAIPGALQYIGQQGNIDRIYSLGREYNECPSGFRRIDTSIGNGISYTCVQDDGECEFHSECPDNMICSGGRCIVPGDF